MTQTTETLKPVMALLGNYRSLSRPSETVNGSMSASAEIENAASDLSTNLLGDRAMLRIWVRMLAIYGHKWASHLGSAVDDKGLLSESARTWQAGLRGLAQVDLKVGFDTLVLARHDWPPSLPEFRALCLARSASGAPSLDEVVAALVMVASRQGSLVARYGHPLVLAVAQELDMFAIRTAKSVDARRMVRPVYERVLADGRPCWPEHADVDQAALGFVNPSVNRALGLSALNAIRATL